MAVCFEYLDGAKGKSPFSSRIPSIFEVKIFYGAGI